MPFPVLNVTENKNHWSYSDNFGTDEYEYIKSFCHENYTIGYHTHDFYELNIVLAGNGYHYIEAMPYSAEPGCVFLIPPHVHHGYLSKDHLKVYHMLIHRRFLEECFAEFKPSTGFSLLFETEPYLRAHQEQKMFLVLSGKELLLLQQDIEAMKDAETVPFSNRYINAIAKKMLCQLCMLFEQKCRAGHPSSDKKETLESVVECLNHIHRHYGEKLTLDALAKRVNLSRSTLIRQFTKACGCSPHQYISRYRATKAAELLRLGMQSPGWIAQECGFYDVSHMRKCLIARETAHNLP